MRLSDPKFTAPRIALLIEYDGTRYAGWQKQLNAVSVQSMIEKAFHACSKYSAEVIGSGRTDAGVHACGQVAHILLPDDFSIPEDRIARAMNSRLAPDIRILSACILRQPFHARFDAIAREYCYMIDTNRSVFARNYAWQVRNPFSIELLEESAAVFPGSHDFTTFSKLNADTESYRCDVEISHWEEVLPGVLKYTVRANRFVYGMVRALVGVMMEVARRRRTVEEVREALYREDRSFISPLAPPQGLFLRRIYYNDDPFFEYRNVHPILKEEHTYAFCFPV